MHTACLNPIDESPVKALLYFFLAVLLVVVSTYILFDAGSIALLHPTRKNKEVIL